VPDGLGADDAVLLRETARIGSNCADVQAHAIIRLYDDGYGDGGDAAEFYDFGRAAGQISRRFYLVNAGHVAADLAVVQSPALPFSWTSGVYPGTSETLYGSPPCGDVLGPQGQNSYCAMSISYSGATTEDGRWAIALTGAYTSEVARKLRGTATSEAVLDYRNEIVNSASVDVRVGETAPHHLIASNRGGAPALSLRAAEDLTPPLSWGSTPTGPAFPGGAGTITLHGHGITYDYCTPVLDVGHECVVTVNFSPTEVGSSAHSFVIEYSTPEGTFHASAFRSFYGLRVGP
jgi:hypothetical protein